MNLDRPLLYEGSVKNIRGVLGSSPYVFEYSDRYSVFDWGGMPDLIEGKGESLATMAWELFSYLSNGENFKALEGNKLVEKLGLEEELQQIIKNGVRHHALGLLDQEGEIMSEGKSAYLAVNPVHIMRPKENFDSGKLHYDYEEYAGRPMNTLVPLEVIFRFGIPEGSSLLKRLKDSDYCESAKIDQNLKSGDYFETPIIEYSTKLESHDKYISYDEARSIAGLSEGEFKKFHAQATLLSLVLKDIFEKRDITLWDGKFEFAFASDLDEKACRNFMLVDSIGPDELRLTYKEVQLSKENLRRLYRKSPWASAVDEAKKIAEQRGESNWKHICLNELKEKPQHLEREKVGAIEEMYKGLTNSICELNGKKAVFAETKSLDQIIGEFKPS